LKLEHHQLLSTFAFNYNLRRYSEGPFRLEIASITGLRRGCVLDFTRLDSELVRNVQKLQPIKSH